MNMNMIVSASGGGSQGPPLCTLLFVLRCYSRSHLCFCRSFHVHPSVPELNGVRADLLNQATACPTQSALSAIASQPDLIHRLFVSKTYNPEGVYRVRVITWFCCHIFLRFPCRGCWKSHLPACDGGPVESHACFHC